MMVRLATLVDADAEPTARWREAARANLRTPYVRTVEEQREFIQSLPAHRHEYRYWAVRTCEIKTRISTMTNNPALSASWQAEIDGPLVGIAGLSPIQWESGIAEISLALNPACIGKGYGGQAFALLLGEAFDAMRLHQVVAQVYTLNPALGFWRHMSQKYGDGKCVVLPAQKFWDGQYHDAEYFTFQRKAKS